AYFIPLSVGDALAVQFQVDALRGLPVVSVQGVMALVDELRHRHGRGQFFDTDQTGRDFFLALEQKFPEVMSKWKTDQGLWVDPLGAFQLVLVRSREVLGQWLKKGPEKILPARWEEVLQERVGAVMTGYDHHRWPDDVVWRKYLRTEALEGCPSWAKPGI
ncbi:MAG: hypothetical protein HQK55_10190, partial [Deltaproteobacteria bacterium]|nr:hypothetical protein [Deltaproteobacteria bacterium]